MKTKNASSQSSKATISNVTDDFKPLNYQQRNFMKAFSNMNPQLSHVDRGSVYSDSFRSFSIQAVSY
jgi:hypothetical protein